MPEQKTIKELAREFALQTTPTRCAYFKDAEKCDKCKIKICDFRSRVEGFLAGFEAYGKGLDRFFAENE